MPINADKPHLWKSDVNASVDMFNQWFLLFAPKAYRDSRTAATLQVEDGIRLTRDLTALTPDILRQHPGVLQVLRMSTCLTCFRTWINNTSRTTIDLEKNTRYFGVTT